MQDYPRVLVLSNECFSATSSNGRTLRNFFVGWPSEKLAQFYIHGAAPDMAVCHRYYCVSDGAALRSFFNRKPAAGERQQQSMPDVPASEKKNRVHRNAASMMIRNLVWNSMQWAGRPFYNWVEAFAPERILLQAGDSAFMLRLARKLAKKYNVPLILYNSEAYYFKPYDYFRAGGLAGAMYPLFYRNFCREFERTIHAASCSIYCCDKLKQDYDGRFGLPSQVIYTSGQQTAAVNTEQNGPLRISYLGNLGLERHRGLVEIGNGLQSISQNLKLDVYGKLPNAQVQKDFEDCPGICYHGFVSYEKVQEIISQSHILVHTESFSDFYREDLKYAFSTKIADSLASGRCFLLYAPEEMACTEYLKAHRAAWVVDRQEDLLPVLKKLTEDPAARCRYIDQAAALAASNHSLTSNTKKFQQLLREYTGEMP